MSFRNLSAQYMFERLALEHRPARRFAGSTPAEFTRWKGETLPRVLACLGEFPQQGPLNPELTAEWEHDGLRKQRWIIDVQTAPLGGVPGQHPWRPSRRARRRPSILCCHGHGPFGKEPVMGNDSSPELRDSHRPHHYNYGHQMAKAGFRHLRHRLDRLRGAERQPEAELPQPGRAASDWCNLYYLHATMLGMTSALHQRHPRHGRDRFRLHAALRGRWQAGRHGA